jgi:hypothetical protein
VTPANGSRFAAAAPRLGKQRLCVVVGWQNNQAQMAEK